MPATAAGGKPGGPVRALDATRAAGASLEVVRERLRIARHLRAAVGGRLASIIATCRRSDAGRTGDGARAVAAKAREALAQVRAVADDYRDRSLAGEVAAARTVLAAAGVEVVVGPVPERLPGPVDALLGAILRRTVLDALRAASPRSCRIELDGSARMRVSFTGGQPGAPASVGIAEEVERLGGRLRVGTGTGGVDVRIPVQAHRPGATPGPRPVAAAVLCRLRLAAQRLVATRRELVRLAVLRERLRIARNTHDLLGSQLSAIALKAELAGRLAETDRAAARIHLAEAGQVAVEALASLHSVTAEPAGLSFAQEVESARSMLTAAGTRVVVELHAAPWPSAESPLAIVLREAVTNVVRHSRARTCDIETRSVPGGIRLRIANDGVESGAPDATAGNGLANLLARAHEAGGQLTIHRQGDRFTLVAELRTYWWSTCFPWLRYSGAADTTVEA